MGSIIEGSQREELWKGKLTANRPKPQPDRLKRRRKYAETRLLPPQAWVTWPDSAGPAAAVFCSSLLLQPAGKSVGLGLLGNPIEAT
ncbi:hypothetical protein RRG08_026002 [Elysia crispata]|uniref:Uncharacterized protein n=1 Tax=Elysia crispata TaxID=231223 RepID=A0AAE1B661_9GAST|nr:hypothetical protein RRG08_026002 [Elysia crispata]